HQAHHGAHCHGYGGCLEDKADDFHFSVPPCMFRYVIVYTICGEKTMGIEKNSHALSPTFLQPRGFSTLCTTKWQNPMDFSILSPAVGEKLYLFFPSKWNTMYKLKVISSQSNSTLTTERKGSMKIQTEQGRIRIASEVFSNITGAVATS